MTVHREQIKHPQYRKLGVSRHLQECNKNCDIKEMFRITPFYKLKSHSDGTIKEKQFIARFKPKLNNLSLN